MRYLLAGWLALAAVLPLMAADTPTTTKNDDVPTCLRALFGHKNQSQIDPQLLATLTRLADQQQQLIAILQQLIAAQQHPQSAQPQSAQPQIIVLGPGSGPLQTLPLQGAPQQTLPLQGAPLQTLPLQGQPQQTLPIQGSPQQTLPIQGAPPQVLPIQGGSPQQTLPVQGDQKNQGIAKPTPAPGPPPPIPAPTPAPNPQGSGAPKQDLLNQPATTQPAIGYQRYVKAIQK